MEQYIVKENDTITSISRIYGITPIEIIKANNLEKPYNLVIGQSLNIPVMTNDIFDFYKVADNDTLYSIAKKYDTTIDMIASINGIDQEDYIYKDQSLLVPKVGIKTYITKMGDSIYSVATYFNATPQEMLYSNNDIYLLPEQLIIYRS